MKLLLTGASGFIGRPLVRQLCHSGYVCYIVSQRPERARQVLPSSVHVLAYDEPWPAVDAVLNMAGENVAGLWTREKRRRIYHSRIVTTRRLVAWMRTIEPRPQTFVSMSAVGIYGHRPGETLTEASAPDKYHKFRAEVTLAWEAEANAAAALDIRVVTVRMGNVLHPDGGYLAPLLAVYNLLPILVGLGHGAHHFSWISRRDAVRLLQFVLETPELQGPINASAPNPITAAAFTQLLGQALYKPAWGRLPDWLLQSVLGSFASALLDSQYVLPTKAEAHDFQFDNPQLGAYLRLIIP